MKPIETDKDALNGAGSRYWAPPRLPGEPIERVERTAKRPGDVEIFTYQRPAKVDGRRMVETRSGSMRSTPSAVTRSGIRPTFGVGIAA